MALSGLSPEILNLVTKWSEQAIKRVDAFEARLKSIERVLVKNQQTLDSIGAVLARIADSITAIDDRIDTLAVPCDALLISLKRAVQNDAFDVRAFLAGLIEDTEKIAEQELPLSVEQAAEGDGHKLLLSIEGEEEPEGEPGQGVGEDIDLDVPDDDRPHRSPQE